MNKTEIKYFTSHYVEKLYRLVASTENFDNYFSEEFPFEHTYAKGQTGIFLTEDLKLNPDKKYDLENSILLYENLRDLNEVQASDERLWVYLTHVRFWDYMTQRWPIDGMENPLNRIKRRYFLRGLSLESIARNGLSRLWWYAHLTYDESRGNKYELLEVLMSKQDLIAGITERAFWANRNLRVAILEYLKENPEIASNENQTRELLKSLNLIGGVKILPLLTINEIKKILLSTTLNIAA